MKKLLITVLIAASLGFNLPGIAQANTTITETTSHSVFKGLFQTVWAHLKALNPTPKQSAKTVPLYAAGIRGAETTETLLKPYWKGDLIQDEKFQAELQKFSMAQAKMDQGELQAAIKSFDSFLDEFGYSSLRPNALFAKSISLAGIGQKQRSLNTMRQFIDENPNHPLVSDARQVIDELD